MSTPHPELELLAELAEPGEPGADASAPERAEVMAHIAGCDKCSADVAALRSVRDTLRALPPVPMPDDVATRLEGALRAAAAPASRAVAEQAAKPDPAMANVSVLPRRSAARAKPPHISAAAAVLVVVVVAMGAGIAALASRGGGHHTAASTQARSAAGAASDFSTSSLRRITSGNDYDATSIRPKLAALVMAQVPGAAASFHALAPLAAQATAAPAANAAAPQATSSASAASSTRFDAAATAPAAAAPRSPAGPLAAPSALEACVVKLVGKAERPLLVDYALFKGQPATIIVLPDPDTSSMLDVYVEADTVNCAQGDMFTYWASLPTGS